MENIISEIGVYIHIIIITRYIYVYINSILDVQIN